MTGFTAWAPNAHALIVHFPIGLLVTAAVVDLIALLRADPRTPVTVSTGLYAAGAVAVLAAYLTGRAAAAEVYTPGLALPLVAQHWDRALWCVWYFGLVAAARVTLAVRATPLRRKTTVYLWAAGFVGVLLLAATADLGGPPGLRARRRCRRAAVAKPLTTRSDRPADPVQACAPEGGRHAGTPCGPDRPLGGAAGRIAPCPAPGASHSRSFSLP